MTPHRNLLLGCDFIFIYALYCYFDENIMEKNLPKSKLKRDQTRIEAMRAKEKFIHYGIRLVRIKSKMFGERMKEVEKKTN